MTSVNYQIPVPALTEQWAASVPDGFVVHMKIFGLFSYGSCQRSALPHSAQALLGSGRADASVHLESLSEAVVQRVWVCFREALKPLQEHRRLGVVVAQFTSSFRPGRQSFARLRMICKECAPTRVAAEFRSPEWGVSAEALALLRELEISVVLTDDNGSYNLNNNFRKMPQQLRGADLGYCRIHRRPLNRETGLICERVTREDIQASMEPNPKSGLCIGDLSPDELAEWASLLCYTCSTMKPGGRLYVHVSTVGRNASADNVDRLRAALGSLAAPWPPTLVSADEFPEACWCDEEQQYVPEPEAEAAAAGKRATAAAEAGAIATAALVESVRSNAAVHVQSEEPHARRWQRRVKIVSSHGGEAELSAGGSVGGASAYSGAHIGGDCSGSRGETGNNRTATSRWSATNCTG